MYDLIYFLFVKKLVTDFVKNCYILTTNIAIIYRFHTVNEMTIEEIYWVYSEIGNIYFLINVLT